MVTKILNETFGYDGWCLEVKNTTREEPMKDEQGRYHVSYIATARITHQRSGVYRGKPVDLSCYVHARQILLHFKITHLVSTKEDCGAGDAIDKSLATASGNALKGAVTDAMKRAARHFGEKLGNSLYHDGFNANNAPPTLKEALDMLDIDRAKSRFGFEKDGERARQNNTCSGTQGMIASNSAQAALETKRAPMDQTINNAKPSNVLAEQKPRTQYVGNVVMEHHLNTAKQHEVKPSHVQPHHGAGINTTQNMNTAPSTSAKTPTLARVTPINRTASVPTNKSSSVDLSMFDLRHNASNVGTIDEKENAKPVSLPVENGLNLPARPGTSRGAPESPTSAYIANYSDGNDAIPSMFGAHGTMSQALVFEQSQSSTTIAQSLKRKSETMQQTPSAGLDAKWTKNPYNC